MANYVKFQRGSEQAYAKLAVKNQDTLYFIYDGNDATAGKLYLGERLISGIGQGTSVTTLAQLQDVLIENTPSAGSFLVYTDGKWASRSLEAVAALIAAEKTLGFEVDTNAFKFTPVSSGNVQKLELIGFNEATVDAVPFKGTDGSLKWGTPKIISDMTGRLNEFNEQLNNFNANLEAVVQEKIADLNHLSFKKVGSLEEAIENNTIYLVPNPDATIKNDYLEYLIIDGSPELLGNLNTGEINLDNYATIEALQGVSTELVQVKADVAKNKEDIAKVEENLTKVSNDFIAFTSVVGDITKLNTYNPEVPHTIIDELNSINERLQWEEIPV